MSVDRTSRKGESPSELVSRPPSLVPLKHAICIDASDTVATTIEALEPGEAVVVTGAGAERTLAAVEAIPRGHKIALAPVRAGQLVTKYGEVIGRATADIVPGACVHSHNLEAIRARRRAA